jgi:hypothetical protein
MAILAMAAGKHVYVEKALQPEPLRGRIVAAGGQQISADRANGRPTPFLRSHATDHSGNSGRPHREDIFRRGWYVNNRPTIGHGKPAPVPEGWITISGRARRRAVLSLIIWFLTIGTGAGFMAPARRSTTARMKWMSAAGRLGVDWPTRVSSNGGRYQFQDDWETPDTQTIAWDFAEGKTMSWEGRSCNDYPVEGRSRGALIYGTDGTRAAGRRRLHYLRQEKKIVKQARGTEVVDPTNTVSGSGIGHGHGARFQLHRKRPCAATNN